MDHRSTHGAVQLSNTDLFFSREQATMERRLGTFTVVIEQSCFHVE